LFAGDGVVELQGSGVEEVASVAGEAGEVFEEMAGGAVEGIAYERMPDGGEMNSDLMGAARVQAYLERGVGWRADENLRQGPGRFAGWAGGPHVANAWVGDEADGGEDFVGVVLGGVLGEGAIDLLNLGSVPVCGELRGCVWGFGEEDDAGGGSAKAVDGVGVGGVLSDEAQESFFEEAAAGEGGEAAGFVDGEEMGVVVENVEVLGSVWFAPGGTVPDEGLACGEGFTARGTNAVEGDFAVV